MTLDSQFSTDISITVFLYQYLFVTSLLRSLQDIRPEMREYEKQILEWLLRVCPEDDRKHKIPIAFHL